MHRVHETFIALAAQLHEIHEAAKVRNLPENMILKFKNDYFSKLSCNPYYGQIEKAL